ncbi:MAG: ATP-binding protein, partial [Thermomicrobiales bacterium]
WQSADPRVAERAAALYRGALLPEDLYEEWAVARGEAIRASYLALLVRLSGLHEARGDLTQAVAVRERILTADPLDEAAHTAIMRLHARLGNRDLALTHYARFAERLERELGTTPERETQALAAAIRDGRLAPTPPPRMAREPAIPPPARLPAAVDALVGRERELAELERLLAGARLVTLTGPGGIGKTRLALETARAGNERYPDGVAFVDLAPLRDPALVLPTVARALGIEGSAGQPIGAMLATAVGERRLLLVLDNLEQVVAAAPGIGVLLTTCPNLTILATSRARLGLRGEQEYPVSPLPLPEFSPGGIPASLMDLEQTPAVALFARRAQAARPSFRLSADNAEAVAAVCRRLDGLPLAIELAAARVRVLSPEQLLRLMARPRDVLGMTGADLPPRQRTLRDTIAWSHDLLAPHEQMLFRRLAVFAGGCGLEGAEAIDGVPLPSARGGNLSTIDTLAALIDQSLVQARPGLADVETRYIMLETIREFAVEQLHASGEAGHVQRTFEMYLIELAVQIET